MKFLRYLLAAIVVWQALFGSGALLLNRWLNSDTGVLRALTASSDERVRYALGEDATIAELVRSHIPADEIVFVDWPITFQADPTATDIGQEAAPVIHWLGTIERIRMLTYPSPTIFRMMPNAFAAAESMVGAGEGDAVWIAAPGEMLTARIAPSLPQQAAEHPASFGIPAGRAGWSLAAQNPRCQLWRYQKD